MKRFFIWLTTLSLFLFLAIISGIILVLYYFGQGLPDYEQLKKYQPPVVSRLYANDGRLFAEYAIQKRVFVPLEAIPKRVIDTFLAAEDKNFYDHSGLDYLGILRACIINLSQIGQNKRPMGASTITQQVAKNLLLIDIANQVSYERKIKEAILVFRIENALSKNKILEIYLNEIYLGGSCYGIAAAALTYFNKSLDELTIAETAYLAGLPKAPSRYNPKTHYQAAKARRDWVIGRLYEEKIISAQDAIEAKQSPITLRQPDPTHVVKADFFAEEVRRYVMTHYGELPLYQGGLAIRTTLNPRLQAASDKALKDGLIAYDTRHGWRGPLAHLDSFNPSEWHERLEKLPLPRGLEHWKLAVVIHVSSSAAEIGLLSGEKNTIPLENLKWARKSLPNSHIGPEIHHPKDVLNRGDVIAVELAPNKKNYILRQIPKVGGAALALDPHTGRILAMSGGFSFEISQFNRATQAIRQPGSAIKPFVYLAAMERGFSPNMIVSDSPISIVMGHGLGVYSPKNVTSNYYGPVPLRVGLQKSLNMMTIRLVHEHLGMKYVKKIIEEFDIMDHVPLQLAIALGAGETTVLRLATAYGILANGGKRLKPILIDRIQDRHGKTIFIGDNRKCVNCQIPPSVNVTTPHIEDTREQIADPRSIYQITSMLEGAVRSGSARRAQSLNKIVAAKTGTTNDEKDAWTIMYTPDLVFAAYVGFDNPRSLGHMQGGAQVALPIAISFMQNALENVPSKPFKIPSGMKLIRIQEMTGQPAKSSESGAIYEALKNDQNAITKTNDAAQGTEIGISPAKDASPEILSSPIVTGTGGLY